MITSMGNQHQLLHTCNKGMGSNDPPVTIDLPYDYDKVYFRFLTQNERAPKQFVTNDINMWFNFPNPVNFNEISGLYVPQISYDHSIFPDCSYAVDNGNFSLQFSFTRKEI